MKKIKLLSALLSLLFVAMLISSCVDDEFDTPPTNPIPVGEVKTISQIKTQHFDQTITEDISIYATVTMDDKSGNIYKTAYIQDGTDAIALHLDASGGIYQGDSVRIQLNGLKVGKYRELYQIDDPSGEGFTLDKYITKVKTLVNVEPEVVTISDLVNKQAKLIKLENVQFVLGDAGVPYADSENELSLSLTIQDATGKTAIVRTSGYASFADSITPSGSGSLIATVGQYNDDMQLQIRSLDEVLMDAERFDVKESIMEFDYFDSKENLFEFSVSGNQKWVYDSHGYAKMTGYDGSNFANEDWLLTPALDFSGKSNVVLNFRHAAGYVYTGVWDDLQVMVSTDYTGEGNPNSATWSDYTFTTPPTSPFWTWADSGDIDLSSYDGESSVYIAFKYKSTTSNCSTWEVDNVVLSEGTK